MVKHKFTGENLAFSIELICEEILKNVTELVDLKSLSLVNRAWHSLTQKYLESKSVVKLKNHHILPFLRKTKKKEWRKKNIAITYLANNPTKYDYFANGYKVDDISKVMERLPKIGDKVISLQLQIGNDMRADEIFNILRICQNMETLHLSFVQWELDVGTSGKNAAKTLPQTFSSLKKLIIEDSQSSGWEFCHEYLLQTIPLSCQSVKLSGWGQDTGGFLLSMNELLPKQLGQFTSMDIGNQILPETWRLLIEGNLSQVTDFKLAVNDSDVEEAEEFLERYKNQLTNLGLHLFLEDEELRIPEMNNLRTLDLHWYAIFVLKTDKVKIEDGSLRKVCAYPKLRKLVLHGKVREDGREMMTCLSDIAIRGGMGQRLNKIFLDLHLTNCAYRGLQFSDREENRRNEVQLLFPHAEIEFDYPQAHLPKDNDKKLPKYSMVRLSEAFRRFIERTWLVRSLNR